MAALALISLSTLASFTGYGLASVTEPSILPTPPMGFNNWARFMCDLNESLITTTADAMVSSGLLSAGYNRINLDDCWMQRSRAADSSLQWNTTLFPRGIPWLADYVKAKGFRFGIYADAGNLTCGGFPGSLGHEALDAKTFSDWKVEYLKLDGCNLDARPGQTLEQRYKQVYGQWHSVLPTLNPPIAFSESAPAYFSGGSDFPAQNSSADWHRVMYWARLYGDLARHSNDIRVYGLYNPDEYWPSIMTNYEYQIRLARYQAPGFYNDPDFLIPDWPWLTIEEKKSHFALWASFSAPLIISARVGDLKAEEIAYLTNKDIIAVDQDSLAQQATLVGRSKAIDVLTRSLSNGDRLLTVLNRGDESVKLKLGVEKLGLSKKSSYLAKDLWTGSTTNLTGTIGVNLQKHATAIYRISNVASVKPTGMIFTTAKTFLCLGATSTNVTFTECTDTDAQIWSIMAHGRVSPLSSPGLCLMQVVSKPGVRECSEAEISQEWVYGISGNLVNTFSGLCLTQRGEIATLEVCGDFLDEQILGIPSGVVVGDLFTSAKQ